MSITQQVKESIARRVERVITNSENPQRAMDEIARVAADRGLIVDEDLPRRESPLAFVMDLWTDNPVILDRLNLVQPLPNAKTINDVSDVLDALP